MLMMCNCGVSANAMTISLHEARRKFVSAKLSRWYWFTLLKSDPRSLFILGGSFLIIINSILYIQQILNNEITLKLFKVQMTSFIKMISIDGERMLKSLDKHLSGESRSGLPLQIAQVTRLLTKPIPSLLCRKWVMHLFL